MIALEQRRLDLMTAKMKRDGYTDEQLAELERQAKENVEHRLATKGLVMDFDGAKYRLDELRSNSERSVFTKLPDVPPSTWWPDRDA